MIARISTPAAISIEACVCLKAWNDTAGNLLVSSARDQDRVTLFGDSSSPSMVQNTRAGAALA